MALQIANPAVVAKVESLARATGLSKTAAVEKAVDMALADQERGQANKAWRRLDAILVQIDRVPELNQVEALEWDEHGLPK